MHTNKIVEYDMIMWHYREVCDDTSRQCFMFDILTIHDFVNVARTDLRPNI